MQEQLKTIVLHGHISSPNVLKCAITMEYLNVPYEVKIWDITFDRTKGRNLDDSLDKLSPNGRVPVINDPNTGIELWESGAIVNYLKRQYDHTAKLGPKNDSKQSIKDQAELDKWEMLLLTTIGPMTGQLVWFSSVQSASDSRSFHFILVFQKAECFYRLPFPSKYLTMIAC